MSPKRRTPLRVDLSRLAPPLTEQLRGLADGKDERDRLRIQALHESGILTDSMRRECQNRLLARLEKWRDFNGYVLQHDGSYKRKKGR